MVTIIIPVYNAEAWLHSCLDSVLSQSYHLIEVIAVNDGSTDGSQAILEDRAKKDSRLRLCFQENQGVGAARNLGLDLARGDWICFVDADDRVHPDYVKDMLEAALRFKADAVAVNFYLDFPSGLKFPYPFILARKRLTGKQAVRQTFRLLFFPGFVWNKLFRKNLFTDHGIRFPSIIYEDAFVVPLLFLHSDRVIVLKRARYHYLRQPKSLTHHYSFHHARQYLTAANMLRHYFWKQGLWESWRISYSHWLNRIMVQTVLSLYLTKRSMSRKDRRLLVRQTRANIQAMKESPRPGDREDRIPLPLGKDPSPSSS